MSKCKHEARTVTASSTRKTYDAHLKREDARRLSEHLAPGRTFAEVFTVVGDGFDIHFTPGHNGAVLIRVVERDARTW